MKKYILTLLFINVYVLSFCQKQANIWYFGDKAGLDLNTDPPTPLLDGQTDFHPPLGFNEGSSSISDSSGLLLFYTNGEKIWNKQHLVMPNGNGLMGHSSSSQSSIIVPMPKSERFFYVFTTDAIENQFQNGLRYSIVDMCLNNGMGDVMPNFKNVPLVSLTSEKLLCIRHSNDDDYWILVHKYNTNAYYALKLTSSGITDTVISNVGTIDISGWAQMSASPNGQKIAYAIPNNNGALDILDFDPSTGILSNPQVLSTSPCNYSSCFSQDGSKLYVTSGCIGKIEQYNLNAGSLSDIITSATTIVQNNIDYYYAMMQRSLDGKIYISMPAAPKKHLSVIEFPNNLGFACNFIDSAIYLGGKNTSFGLPNFIVGHQYSNTKVYCQNDVNENENSENILVYPNPADELVNVKLPDNQKYLLKLFDTQGISVFEKSEVNGIVEIDCKSFDSGVYYLHVINNENISCLKILVR